MNKFILWLKRLRCLWRGYHVMKRFNNELDACSDCMTTGMQMAEKGERCGARPFTVVTQNFTDTLEAAMRMRQRHHYFWPGFADELADAIIKANLEGNDMFAVMEQLFDKAREAYEAIEREYGGILREADKAKKN